MILKAVAVPNLNITYRRKEKQKKMTKKYKRYYDNEVDFDDDIDGSASESNEGSNNFDDDDGYNNPNYEKKTQ